MPHFTYTEVFSHIMLSRLRLLSVLPPELSQARPLQRKSPTYDLCRQLCPLLKLKTVDHLLSPRIITIGNNRQQNPLFPEYGDMHFN